MDDFRGVLSIALALLMASVSIAIPAQAGSAYYAEDRLKLETPIADENGIDCTTFDGCPDYLEGVSYHDHRVGPEIPNDGDEDLKWVFWNVANIGYMVYHHEVVIYELCMFDQNEEPLGCDETPTTWYSFDDLPADTEYVRTILREGAMGEYSLEIWGKS